MAFYFDVVRNVTTNGTAATLSTHLRALTVSNQETAKIFGLYAAARSGTAGGGQCRLITAGASGTGGTAQTPAERNANGPAASTTWFNDATAITAGTTPTSRVTVGFAQTGGMGGWMAMVPDAAVHLLAPTGANNNAEVATLANAALINVELTVEFSEG